MNRESFMTIDKSGRIELLKLPFNNVLSLEPLIDYWKERANDNNILHAGVLSPLIERMEKTQELRGEISDIAVIKKHADIVDVLMSSIYPLAQRHNQIAASIAPFEFKVFYSTEQYDAIVGLTEEELAARFLEYKSKAIFTKTLKAYSFILQQLYGIENKFEYPMVFNLTDNETGLEKFYQLTFDLSFMKVVLTGEKPVLTDNCISELLESPANLKLWMEKLPPERFEIHGFTTITAIDVTHQQVLSQLKNDLLERDAIVSYERFSELENKLKSYFGSTNIRLGLAYLPEKENALQTGYTVGNSFILSDSCMFSCEDLGKSIYTEAFKTGKIKLIENLEKYEDASKVEREILKLGVKNIIIAPLKDGEEVFGVLEIGSTVPGELTPYDKFRVKEILSLFSVAIKRGQEERQNKIQALIKEECTAIHPVVEWRFVQAAVKLMKDRVSNRNTPMETIVFNDVYPLYGVSDIRNSSNHRNEAIRDDLTDHMNMVQEIISVASKLQPLPFLDEMDFRLSNYLQSISQGLNSGDEVTIIEFLNSEVAGVLAHLKSQHKSLEEVIDKYEKNLDPKLKSFYKRRKDYELSVSTLNETISNFLDEAEVEAQNMFPHYFEKYKTDGVEHGIYIGASMVNDRTFDMMYLHNLRLWQLITMCETARRTERLLPELLIPLEASHLILVQDTPLSVRFRYDEKKFDVDGTYNIRYEIMKKRIDKAIIEGTSERLTQPGKIAVVYSQNKEAAEYVKYIEYLHAKGYLEKETEYLDLESMQGINGLKAIRVSVNLNEDRKAINSNEVNIVLESVRESVN